MRYSREFLRSLTDAYEKQFGEVLQEDTAKQVLVLFDRMDRLLKENDQRALKRKKQFVRARLQKLTA